MLIIAVMVLTQVNTCVHVPQFFNQLHMTIDGDDTEYPGEWLPTPRDQYSGCEDNADDDGGSGAVPDGWIPAEVQSPRDK